MYEQKYERENENKAYVRSFYEEYYNDRRLEAIDDSFSPAYVHHTSEVPGGTMNYEEYREHMLVLSRAFPHMKVTIDDQVAEKDKVATRLTMYGIQEGDLPGIPSKGREIKVGAMTIFRIADSRIAEGWESYDSLEMALQLGVAQVVSTLGKGQQEKGYFPDSRDYNI